MVYYLMACRERRLCGTAFFHFFDIYTTLWAVLYECGRTCNIWILQYYVNIHLLHHAHYQPTFVQMVCSDSFAISHNVVGHFQSVLLRFRMLKYVVLGDINKTTTQKEFRFHIIIFVIIIERLTCHATWHFFTFWYHTFQFGATSCPPCASLSFCQTSACFTCQKIKIEFWWNFCHY